MPRLVCREVLAETEVKAFTQEGLEEAMQRAADHGPPRLVGRALPGAAAPTSLCRRTRALRELRVGCFTSRRENQMHKKSRFQSFPNVFQKQAQN